jgi:1,4-dihydroxy-2-naphthoate octaprenyltransferase
MESMDFATVKDILKLTRWFASIAFVWYFVGAFFALLIGAMFDAGKLILGYCIVLPGVMVGTLTNSYYDVAVDKHSTATPVSGGTKVLSDRPELMKTIRNLIVFLFSLSLVLGLVFTIVFSFPVTFFAFIVVADFLAWAYTAPPLRLVYRGFGELWTMIMGGFVIGGFGYFVVKETIDLTYLLFSIPIMLMMFAFAFYVEIPDRDADLQGHKKTLVVRKDERFGFIIGSVALVGATVCFLLFYLLRVFPSSGSFLIIGLYSIIPVAFAVQGLRKYVADTTTVAPSVFRSSISILSVIMFIDAYFAYAIIT